MEVLRMGPTGGLTTMDHIWNGPYDVGVLNRTYKDHEHLTNGGDTDIWAIHLDSSCLSANVDHGILMVRGLQLHLNVYLTLSVDVARRGFLLHNLIEVQACAGAGAGKVLLQIDCVRPTGLP